MNALIEADNSMKFIVAELAYHIMRPEKLFHPMNRCKARTNSPFLRVKSRSFVSPLLAKSPLAVSEHSSPWTLADDAKKEYPKARNSQQRRKNGEMQT